MKVVYRILTYLKNNSRKGESSYLAKQETIYCSLGNVEVEFRVMAHGICEGMWLKRLLK